MRFEIGWGVKQTGPQLGHLACDGAAVVAPGIHAGNALDRIAVALHWPATAMEYFNLRAKHKREGADWVDFVNDPAMARRMGFDSLIAGKRKFLLAVLQFGDQVEFDYKVDTGHPSYLKLEAPGPPPGAPLEIRDLRLEAVARRKSTGNGGPLQFEARVIPLSLGGFGPPGPHAGYVALDFGNTWSTLVALPRTAEGVKDIEVIGVERPWSTALPAPARSALRIKGRSAAPGDSQSRYAPFDCEIGRPAERKSSGDGLFLGAKRLLADLPVDPLDDGTIPLVIDDAPQRIGRREPAELFLAQMLEAFHNQRHAHPEQIALTCPTTFSSWEVDNLKTAAYHAWARSQSQERRDPGKADLHRAIPRMTDEASAAAFYFVFRDFLSAPGRLAGLRYYGPAPRGVNLLLYDCGGGTTDIALVNVVSEDARRVAFKVLGRSGHRDFGGDAITMAVYRALKAKIAARLDPTLRTPDSPAELPGFLVNREKRIDACAPTSFDGATAIMANPEIRRRREATLLLWRWAERVKIEGLARPDEGGGAPTVVPLADEFQRLTTLMGWPSNAVSELSNGVPISRDEVDVLIRPDVLRTVEYATHLIRSRLPRGREIDFVYVVGGASRYPLIRETLLHKTEGLPIRDVARRFQEVAVADLKNAVAKGAVLAQWVDYQFKGFHVEFDQELMNRLPYDLKFRDMALASDRILFRENTLYQDLGEVILNISQPVNGDSAREARLGRCWPGDTEPRDHLEFAFQRPVAGRVKLWYDAHRRRFAMQPLDGGSTGVVHGRAQESSIHDAPPLIGEARWPPIKL